MRPLQQRDRTVHERSAVMQIEDVDARTCLNQNALAEPLVGGFTPTGCDRSHRPRLLPRESFAHVSDDVIDSLSNFVLILLVSDVLQRCNGERTREMVRMNWKNKVLRTFANFRPDWRKCFLCACRDLI